ncbi:MAG: bi-domain-containing oxidoreductase [Planctomycetota bacterium]
MRQILCNRGGAVVARMPRPTVAPGQVLVRTQFSLVSVGTEIAPLRSITSELVAHPIENAGAYASLARRYLGKAIKDPRKAFHRAAGIVRRELGRMNPVRPRAGRAAAPVRLGEVAWERANATQFNVEDGRMELVTDASAASYQVLTQPIPIPGDRCAAFELGGELLSGRLAVGLLDASRERWIGQHTLEPGRLDDRLIFDPGDSEQVTLVIANAGGTQPSRLVLERFEVQLLPRSEAQNDLGDQGWNVGYSLAGTVVEVAPEVTDLAPGDRVACAGANYAHHAEYVCVPRNLLCRVPVGCTVRDAATATVGAIALQGVRRAGAQLGEVVCVLGLGLIGQITVQLLHASGCRVLGMDLDPKRVDRALALGLAAGATDAEQLRRMTLDFTGGHGADRTLITAATRSNQVINQAMEVTRRRGTVVIVGDVGLAVERAEFYRKEIDLLMSTSYGPGRYDAHYEEDGADYPYAYVRWTLNRNMQAYLQLIAEERLRLEPLIDRVIMLEDAPAAYRELARGGDALPLGVLFRYPDEAGREEAAAPRIELRGHRPTPTGPARYALIGVGAFAQGMLVPQMERRRDRFFLRGVVSRDAARGGNFARERRLAVHATDLDSVLDDPEFDLMVIATRHREHAPQVARCLEAGKHVFVEKPLAVTWEQLALVESTYAALTTPPLLMVGFNRRFSPALQQLTTLLRERRTPLVIHYRLHGGYIPPDSWIQGPVGGGRNLGEACHMYDVFRSLVGTPVRSIQAEAIDPGSLPYLRSDNFSATLGYEDGSLATLTYTALGPKQGLAKERVEVFCDGEAYLVDDYKRLVRGSDGAVLWQASDADKGHFEELSRFGDAIATGSSAPIPPAEIFETTAVALRIEDLLHGHGANDRDGGAV